MADRTIDWPAARRRLDQAAAATEDALRPSAERRRAILDERARALAATPPAPAAAGSRLEAVAFTLGDERFAVATRFVHQVAPIEDFTSLPGVPAELYGVTALGGEILPIVDLRRLLGQEPGRMTELARLIVVGGARPELALLVDDVDRVVDLAVADIAPPPETVHPARAPLIAGVTADALILLDGEALLADPRLHLAATPDKESP